MTVSSDQRTALVGQYLILQEVNADTAGCGWRASTPTASTASPGWAAGPAPRASPSPAYGDELMRAGLVTTDEDPASEGDFASHLYLIEAAE